MFVYRDESYQLLKVVDPYVVLMCVIVSGNHEHATTITLQTFNLDLETKNIKISVTMTTVLYQNDFGVIYYMENTTL